MRITGILFGQLIQHELVTSITLGIALRYVLEALRKSPGPGAAASGGGSNGKMFRFGMFALEQFKMVSIHSDNFNILDHYLHLICCKSAIA